MTLDIPVYLSFSSAAIWRSASSPLSYYRRTVSKRRDFTQSGRFESDGVQKLECELERGASSTQLRHNKFRESLPPNFYEVLASRFCHERQLQPIRRRASRRDTYNRPLSEFRDGTPFWTFESL
jgi:hypothetical protein